MVVIGVPHGVLVEIIDDGSAGTSVVKGDLYARPTQLWAAAIQPTPALTR